LPQRIRVNNEACFNSHQHLHGYTPAEAWDGRAKSTKRPLWFDVWEGRITGWFFPP